jgi:hypothetical protein
MTEGILLPLAVVSHVMLAELSLGATLAHATCIQVLSQLRHTSAGKETAEQSSMLAGPSNQPIEIMANKAKQNPGMQSTV